MRTRLSVTLGVVVGVFSLSFISATPAQALNPNSTGDPDLISKVQARLGTGDYNGASVARIDANTGQITYANFGATNTTEYEIGSVSKIFTGQLFADSVSRGESTKNTRLDQALPISAWLPASYTTMGQLATHYGGFDRWPATPNMLIALNNFSATGANPTPFTRNDIISQAGATIWLPGRGQVHKYSNIGSGLLGHSVAARAQSNFKTTLQNRLLNPMGLTNTRYFATANEIPQNVTKGTTNGRVQGVTWGDGYAPALGLRSTIGDMASFTKQVLNNTAPGMDALTPQAAADQPNLQIGYQWYIDSTTGEKGKSGATGGFTSSLIINPVTKIGAVVLINTSDGGDGTTTRTQAVDALAYDILHS